MSFADDVARFAVKVQARTPVVFAGICAESLNSIQNGSALTGSPGQPVGQYGPGYHPGEVGGTLKASWQLEFLAPDEALISTNEPHAESNEDGVARPGGGPYIQRSSVGGRHSVALTLANIQRIADSEAARLNA